MAVQRQINQLLAQRAAEWIEILKSCGPRERAEFAAWLRESKIHVEQYLEMISIDRELRALDPAQCPDVDELLARAAPNVVSLSGGAKMPAEKPQRVLRRRAWTIGLGLAAGVAALGIVLMSPDTVRTGIGEQRTVTLQDGSAVTLNTLTSLRFDFSQQERKVILNSGEAVFKVAHESLRPFVVHTRTAAVRAVGTQFNVYQRPHDTVVSVLEGRVQITAEEPAPQGSNAPARPAVQNLAAGEEAQVRADGHIEKRAHPDVQKSLAWRERRLNFDETPLTEMVREFNRYGGHVRLRIEGEIADSYRYGGVFDADDPESLAALLQRESDLVVQRRSDEIVIRSR